MPTERSWREKLVRSGYFVGAVLLHLVLLLLLAGYVVYKGQPRELEIVTVRPHTPAIHLDPPSLPVDTSAEVPPSSSTVPIAPVPIRVDGGAPILPKLPEVADTSMTVTSWDGRVVKPIKPAANGLSAPRWNAINHFELTYRPPDKIRTHDPSGTYPIYVAKYAHGDWDCNLRRDAEGNIIAGSMPDLTAKILEWSNGSIKANVIPKPLNIGSSELIDTKPPFIFFTGHKDFVLTDQEVKNLQDYLEMGGAIWGDNALAGKGSRFDVAFRREMRRVVGEKENFAPLQMDSDIFSAKEKFQIDSLPLGMNFYAEPIEHLDIEGQVAVLYTPNDYSDLYSMRILPGDKTIAPDHVPPNAPSPLVSNGTFLRHQVIYFRNFSLESSLAAHRLGMNIMIYLITRFDDQLQLPP
jgi:hypothetical protein